MTDSSKAGAKRCSLNDSDVCRYGDIIQEFREESLRNREAIQDLGEKVTGVATEFREFRTNLDKNLESTQKRYDESLKKLTEVVIEGNGQPSLREQLRSNTERVTAIENNLSEKRTDAKEDVKTKQSQSHTWSLTITGWAVAVLLLLFQVYLESRKERADEKRNPPVHAAPAGDKQSVTDGNHGNADAIKSTLPPKSSSYASINDSKPS